MDLASGAKKLIITMTHTTPEGHPKIVSKVTPPDQASRGKNRHYRTGGFSIHRRPVDSHRAHARGYVGAGPRQNRRQVHGSVAVKEFVENNGLENDNGKRVLKQEQVICGIGSPTYLHLLILQILLTHPSRSWPDDPIISRGSIDEIFLPVLLGT